MLDCAALLGAKLCKYMADILPVEAGDLTSMPALRKRELCWRALRVLQEWAQAVINDWYRAGRDAWAPPRVSIMAGGTEEGKYKGKLHLQLALEWWDDEGLSQATISKHVRAVVQPMLDGLIDMEQGETWPLTAVKRTPCIPSPYPPDPAVTPWLGPLLARALIAPLPSPPVPRLPHSHYSSKGSLLRERAARLDRRMLT